MPCHTPDHMPDHMPDDIVFEILSTPGVIWLIIPCRPSVKARELGSPSDIIMINYSGQMIACYLAFNFASIHLRAGDFPGKLDGEHKRT